MVPAARSTAIGSPAEPSAASGTTVARVSWAEVRARVPLAPWAGRAVTAWVPRAGAGATRVKSTGAPTVSPGRSSPVRTLRVTALSSVSEVTCTE